MAGAAVFCLVYYVCCVAYAGFASSFITIWPVTAVFFAGIFAVRYAQNKGILILPMWINVLSAAGLLNTYQLILSGSGINNRADEAETGTRL